MLKTVKEIFETNIIVDDKGERIRVHSHTPLEQGLFLQKIFDVINPKKSLEVGLAYGISTLFILEKHRDIKSSDRAHIVIEPFPWGQTAIYNIQKEGLMNYVDIRNDLSDVIIPTLYLAKERIQFAYVDTTKLFDVVMQDFYFIDKILDVGGVIIIDDCDTGGINKVARFINGLPHYSIMDKTGRHNPSKKYKVAEKMMNVILNHGLRKAPSNIYVYWLSLYFLEDMLYYTMHYLDHHIRILWAGHITHHSSDQFNFSVGIRAAIFEPVEKFIFFIPLAIVGYRTIDILLIYLMSQTFGTLAHTKLIKKLGVLDYFFVTPSNHRVHHAKNLKYLDKNFGMTIVLWDKIFRTYQKEDDSEPVEFGVRRTVPYANFVDVVINEIKQIIRDANQKITFKQKLKYIFGLPGYSHNGSRKTTRQMRQNNLRKE